MKTVMFPPKHTTLKSLQRPVALVVQKNQLNITSLIYFEALFLKLLILK